MTRTNICGGFGVVLIAAAMIGCGGSNSSTATAPAATATAPATTAASAPTTTSAPATASAPASATKAATAPTTAEAQSAALAILSVAKAKSALELIKTTRSFENGFVDSHPIINENFILLETTAQDVIDTNGTTELRRKVFAIALDDTIERADTIAKRPNEKQADKVKATEIRAKFNQLKGS